MWDFGFPIRDLTCAPCIIKVQSNHWTASEVLVWTFQKRGSTVLHGGVHGTREGHGVGSVWLCPPPPVMGRPSLWPPLRSAA